MIVSTIRVKCASAAEAAHVEATMKVRLQVYIMVSAAKVDAAADPTAKQVVVVCSF